MFQEVEVVVDIITIIRREAVVTGEDLDMEDTVGVAVNIMVEVGCHQVQVGLSIQ